MIKIIKNNKYFFIPYLFALIITTIVLLCFSKAQIHLSVNSYHNVFFDKFFFYITNLGDGLFAFIIVLVFLFIRYRYAILIAICSFLGGFISQLLKNYVFNNQPRPYKYFKEIYEGGYNLYTVPGLELHTLDSFPSGHTAIAFSLFLSLTFITKNNFLKSIYFIIALFVAYSRIYLSQHFLIDIFFGSILAVIITIFAFYFVNKINSVWIDKSFIKFK